MALVFDITRCIGCYNCRTACKDEHVGNDGTWGEVRILWRLAGVAKSP